MDESVRQIIEEYKLINENDNIVIGVSGGPDSMALLYLLVKIKKDKKFNLYLAHVNHGVRGEDARADEEFVRKKAEELKLPYYFKKADMLALAKEKSISAEEAGREIRYGFFNEILKEKGGGKIAVAHNKNDQAETLLMRIIRGTGIDGLKGMDYINGNIIRPLLKTNREEIEAYIERNQIETVLDKTNLETIYTRNKIRLELLPYIRDNFNPNIIDSLWRLSSSAEIDNKFLEDYSNNKYNHILSMKSRSRITLDKDGFDKEDRSIQQRIIRRAISDLGDNLQGIVHQHIKMVLDLFSSGETGKEVHLPKDLVARLDYTNLIIEKKKPEGEVDYLEELSLGKNQLKGIPYKINLRVLPLSEMGNMTKGDRIRVFDYGKVKGQLRVRNRRPGDRFTPFGMKGRKKLKDYFIDEKISKDLRDRIPLLIDDEEILWVVGYRTSELYRVNKETEEILVVELQALKNKEDKNGEGY